MKFDLSRGDLNWPQYVWALLPFGLLAIGGAIGGLCGGLAAGLNVKVMKGELGASQKYLVTAFGTVAAVGVYFVLAALFINLTGLGT